MLLKTKQVKDSFFLKFASSMELDFIWLLSLTKNTFPTSLGLIAVSVCWRILYHTVTQRSFKLELKSLVCLLKGERQPFFPREWLDFLYYS